jgi:hypothetical protein
MVDPMRRRLGLSDMSIEIDVKLEVFGLLSGLNLEVLRLAMGNTDHGVPGRRNCLGHAVQGRRIGSVLCFMLDDDGRATGRLDPGYFQLRRLHLAFDRDPKTGAERELFDAAWAEVCEAARAIVRPDDEAMRENLADESCNRNGVCVGHAVAPLHVGKI